MLPWRDFLSAIFRVRSGTPTIGICNGYGAQSAVRWVKSATVRSTLTAVTWRQHTTGSLSGSALREVLLQPFEHALDMLPLLAVAEEFQKFSS